MATPDYHFEAYKLLVGTLSSEEQLLWSRNQVFLVINGAMITALGLTRRDTAGTLPVISNSPALFYALICLFGILITLLWLAAIFRSEAFYNHWFEQLKYLETQYLPDIQTYRNADTYFTEGHITLGGQELKLPLLARFLRIYQMLKITAGGFFLSWALILLNVILSA